MNKYSYKVIENVVDSETSVTVQGTVNGLGLHDLDHEVSNIMSNIKSQSEKKKKRKRKKETKTPE